MPNSDAVESTAIAIYNAWRSGVAIAVKSLAPLPDQVAAYAVQQQVASLLEWVGQPDERRLWKVGGPNVQSTPTAACLPECLAFESGVSLSRSIPGLAGVESEVAFRIGGVDWQSGKAHVAVDACCVAIEVVASRFANADELDPLLKLADQQMNAALVLGPWCALPDEIWTSIVCTAVFDETVLAENRLGHPCGDPLWALGWLADHAKLQGLPLRKGDIVTTGSWLGILPIDRPGVFTAGFVGLGTASVQFD